MKAGTDGSRLKRVSLAALIAVFFLIFVGGTVRATGSGMGCPDWPRCFGRWVPPVSESQLPPDYKKDYAAYRLRKNEKFARVLRMMGMDQTATAILHDQSIGEESGFNAARTWTEYVNRLVGMIAGLFVVAMAGYALPLRKTRRGVTVVAVLSLLIIGFQGWFGSIVVSTNLTPWTVTVHMLLALVIVALLAVMVVYSVPGERRVVPSSRLVLLGLCMLVLVIQVLWGTQVREAVDAAAAVSPRAQWLGNLGQAFVQHRSFAWIVLIVNLALVVSLWRTAQLEPVAMALVVLIVCSMLTGAGMAYFSFPAFLQPLHLLLATVSFGLQMILLLQWTRRGAKSEAHA